ncbi:MAG: hypothetical protein A2W33_07035 [Chloroflexi bacterium RBG_16_52_11]|nr:MAG: hypothetical protein A2W33_07035 [Chloroflexi bacterium RBG_16_52_11]
MRWLRDLLSLQAPVFDPMRLLRIYSKPLLPLRLVIRPVAHEPAHLAVALEGQQVRTDAVQKPTISNYHTTCCLILLTTH